MLFRGGRTSSAQMKTPCSKEPSGKGGWTSDGKGPRGMRYLLLKVLLLLHHKVIWQVLLLKAVVVLALLLVEMLMRLYRAEPLLLVHLVRRFCGF